MEIKIRIPKSVLHWFENGELVKNPEFSNNNEILRVGINANYEDIQTMQTTLTDLEATILELTTDVNDLQGSVQTLASNVSSLQTELTQIKITVPTKVSDLLNDAGYITKAVSDLENYYLKSSLYTKDEVNTLIGDKTGVSIQVVQDLPETGEPNVIYFVPKTPSTNDIYDEYVYISGNWEHIGSTEVDLSNYYNKEQADAKYEVLSNKVTALSSTSTDEQYPSAKCVYDLYSDLAQQLSGVAQAIQAQSEVVS